MGPLIRYHCTHCGTQAAVSVADIVTVQYCGTCGSTDLVLTTATPSEVAVAGVAGEPLFGWKTRYFGGPQVATPPAAGGPYPSAPSAPTPPTRGPIPVRRSTSAPRPPHVAMPTAGGTGPRRPMPVPRKKNNAAVFLVVGCVGCLVLGVVVFAVAMSGNARPPQGADESSAEPVARTNAPPSTKKSNDAEAAVKQFQADSQRVLSDLVTAKEALLKAEADLKTDLEAQRGRILGEQAVAGDGWIHG